MFWCAFTVSGMHRVGGPESVLVCPIDESWSRFKVWVDECPTITTRSRIWLLLKHVSVPWVFRPLLATESSKLQSVALHEVLTPYEYSQMSRRLSMYRVVIRSSSFCGKFEYVQVEKYSSSSNSSSSSSSSSNYIIK